MHALGRAAVPLALAGLVGGCALLPFGTQVPDDQLPVGVRVVTPPGQQRLHAINATTRPVVLDVNGSTRDLAPGDSLELGLADLGPLPWHAAMRLVSGRQLIAATIAAGDDWREHDADGSTEIHSAGSRVDLSCGQLWLSSLTSLHGPAPGSGTPGDCD